MSVAFVTTTLQMTVSKTVLESGEEIMSLIFVVLALHLKFQIAPKIARVFGEETR